MRTYYIFNVNRYFSYMYKNKPFKMYKMFEEIYYEFKLKYGYKRNGNKHNLNTSENSTLQINNYNIKLITENNYSIFFKYLNNYNNNLFVCDFENMDYFWLCKLYNKKSSVELVK